MTGTASHKPLAIKGATRDQLAIEALVGRLAAEGVHLWVEGDKLKFRGPKGALGRDALSELKARKPKLIEFLSRQQSTRARGEGERQSTRARGEGERITFSLSLGQRALYYIHRISPRSAAYHIGVAAKVLSDIDPNALRKAFQCLLNRHASLRTTFAEEGDPVQIVHPRMECAFRITDLGRLGWPQIKQRVEQAHAEPFDLERGPLMRVELFRSSKTQVLLLSIHHIVFDGWSSSILLQELAQLYGSCVLEGRPVELPAPTSQYSEFVRQQQEMLSSPRGEALWEYWREQLSGELSPLALPTDRAAPPKRGYAGSKLSFEISDRLGAELRRFSRERGVTLYTTLLAAYFVLLYRYTHQPDIRVGTMTAGRNSADFAKVIGYFVNPVVMRGRLSNDLCFADFLEQMRDTVLAGFDRQEYPFPLLVQRLRPERTGDSTPLFNVAFIMQRPQSGKEFMGMVAPGSRHRRVKLGQLELEPFEIHQQVGQFDLTLVVVDTLDSALWGTLKYDSDLFDRMSVARMIDHLLCLLEGIVAAPEIPIARLPLLRVAEREELLRQGMGPAIRVTRERLLHHRIAEQARRKPGALAVVCEQQQITFAALDQRADRLACMLHKRGVRPDTLVALCLERSTEMIVALLAIWKAGGAYVALDPDYPAARLSYMLDDSRAALVLTERAWLDRLPIDPERCLCLDRAARPLDPATTPLLDRAARPLDPATTPLLDRAAQPPGPATAPPLDGGVGPGDLAYVIYTSGTTGGPKGVMIEHSSLLNLLEALETEIYDGEDDSCLRVSLNGPLAFDTSVKQLIQLAQGRTLDIIPRAVRADGRLFAKYLIERKIDVLDSTPSQLELLRRAGLLEAPRKPSRILVGGEPIGQELWEALREVQDVRIFNMYGPTECTVDATSVEVHQGPEVPVIGRPLANIQAMILDGQKELLPMGSVGELYLAGPGLARGYLHRPELEDEAFVALPGASGDPRRAYRTGDLCRWRNDGSLQFMGRNDEQVKIRGFRIETGEIESVLRQHPAIGDVAVVARGGEGGVDGKGQGVVTHEGEGGIVRGGEGGVAGEGQEQAKRLVAYLACNAPDKPDAEQLRSELRALIGRNLPAYMMPSAFVLVDRIPLTVHGKLDRASLPEPDWTCGEQGQGSVPPRDDLERALWRIWSELLGIDSFGVRDSFFDLGGHSLLAARLMLEIETRCGKVLPLATLVHSPTIEQLAQSMRSVDDKQFSLPLVPLHGKGDATPFFLVHAVGGSVLSYVELAKRLGPRHKIIGLQSPAIDGVAQPRSSLEQLAEEYVRALQREGFGPPYLIGGWSFGGLVAFEMARLLTRDGRDPQDVALLALIDSYVPSAISWPEGLEHQHNLEAAFSREHNLETGLAREHNLEAAFSREHDLETGLAREHNLEAAFSREHNLENSCAREALADRREPGLESEIHSESAQRERLYKVFAANYKAMQEYSPRPFQGKVHLLCASDEKVELCEDPWRGWGGLAEQGVTRIDVSGTHYTVLDRENVASLAEKLNELLSIAQSSAWCSSDRPDSDREA